MSDTPNYTSFFFVCPLYRNLHQEIG